MPYPTLFSTLKSVGWELLDSEQQFFRRRMPFNRLTDSGKSLG